MPTNAASYASGTSDTPLLGETIGQAFAATVARWPDREALVSCHQGIRWSWRDLATQVATCARALLAIGVAKGDRVGIWSTNRAEWLVTQLATARVGAVLVNVNPSYRVAELEYALNQAGISVLVTTDRFKTSDYHAVLLQLAPELDGGVPASLALTRAPALRRVITLGTATVSGLQSWPDVMALAADVPEEAVTEREALLAFDDPINIQYTSGTTGYPKGATLSHHNILNNGYAVARLLNFTEADRLVVPVPLYHCFGMVMGNLGCITHGATLIYPSEGFDPGAVLQACAEERATALYGVPTMFIAELGHPDFAAYDLSSLRTGLMAGSTCPAEVMKQVQTRMHMSEVGIAYGMTETSPVSTQTRIGAPLEKQVSTVGQVHPHVEVKIIDPDTGLVLPRNATGEFCTRGYSVMLGYWDNEQATRNSIDAAGWMHTGDLAIMDHEGYVQIVGRIKDMVIRGGENIYPREIEEFLYQHPAVEDVQVIGVPDERYGEELMAWVQLHEGAEASAEDLKAHCKGTIAHYKVPRYIHFVKGFPMTVTGKVQKFVMREQAVALLRLAEEKPGINQ